MATVWSCGGGTQSAAIAALIVSGQMPVPDLSVIVDTERERSGTWIYYERVLKPALASVGCDLIRVRKSEYATVDLWGGADKNTLLIPAFYEGRRMPGYCSGEWKSRVVMRVCRGMGIRSGDLIMGMSADEPKRIRVRLGDSLMRPVYPLFDRMMTRRDCIDLVRCVLWDDPPRSACWMCPNAGQEEWSELKHRYPEDWKKAVSLEREIQQRDPKITLRSSGKLEDVSEGNFELGEQCAGMCWV